MIQLLQKSPEGYNLLEYISKYSSATWFHGLDVMYGVSGSFMVDGKLAVMINNYRHFHFLKSNTHSLKCPES